MPVDWDRPLSRRRGAHNRLGGLDVYYDFDWRDMFQHDRAVFPRGQSLAQLVLRDCPDGKTPCLLLTERTDVSPCIQETQDHYVVVVPIRHYLRNAGADAASTYYARLSAAPLTQLPTLSDVMFSASELGSFLDEHLTADTLADWLGRSPARVDVLRDLVESEADPAPASVAHALRDLQVEDVAVLEEFASYVSRVGGGTQFGELLAQVTQFESGRAAAIGALAHRLPERVADIRRQLAAYEELIGDPHSTETDVQRFLEVHPWIVGLPYVSARARVEIPRGQLDFVLERYDGFFDLVELKGPREPIIVERQAADAARPPSASSYSLSPALAGALAQAHHYRALLDETGGLREQYGLADTRQPRIFVVLGTSATLSDAPREILRQLNLSLHRVEVVPYDLVGTRTLGLLNNLQALLAGGRPS